ncbi:MAG: DUF2283 domain-containing protein [Chloroflexi bacterium]|nr:DUF2283 domain-containing protein [Chloroflexota bacterium]
MRVVYDASVDVLEVYLSDRIRELRYTGKELSPGIIADLDEQGNILKLGILDASDRYTSESLATFTVERVPA